MIVDVLGTAFVLSFVICCVGSAVLQIRAWSRHARTGAPIDVRALWRPEGHFDEVGVRQIRLARRLLTMGIVAYLSYGMLILMSNVLAGSS